MPTVQCIGWGISAPDRNYPHLSFNFLSILSLVIAPAPVHPRVNVDAALFPYPSLQSLHLSRCHFKAASLILSPILCHLPKLEELIMEDVELTASAWLNQGPASRPRLPTEIFEHKSLKRLVLIGSFSSGTLSDLTFPSLTLIRICRDKKRTIVHQLPSIFVCVQPSFLDDGVLSLEDSWMRDIDIAAVLSGSRYVKRVHVRSPLFLRSLSLTHRGWYLGFLLVNTIVCTDSPKEWTYFEAANGNGNGNDPLRQDLKIYAPWSRDDPELHAEENHYAEVRVESVRSWVLDEMLSYGIKGHR
ncbi:hypothetical protein FA15DRAFT_709132 [Coprinopsis marcescibilis]|uniref:F-box domain-containing protein n=1 Tax=Coprinopsis marcescibilis TaxID=230819 RepID=A0A5C3KGH8_COPMA|nr:hypothetical protein FA15DRAFT_709132 [Coprinopsis marcescibilis]